MAFHPNEFQPEHRRTGPFSRSVCHVPDEVYSPWALSRAWADFGGIAAQINNLSHVIELSITDHPGIAITYDYRLRLMIRKLAHRRAVAADYFDFLPNAQPDIRNAAPRDFENKAESSRKDKEKQKTAKEREAETRTGKGTDKADRASAKADPKGKQWAEGDWASWKKKQKAGAPAKETDEADKQDEDKPNVSKKKYFARHPGQRPAPIVGHTNEQKRTHNEQIRTI